MFSAQLSNKLEAGANHELTCQALILPQAQEEWRMEQITWQTLANSEQAMILLKQHLNLCSTNCSQFV